MAQPTRTAQIIEHLPTLYYQDPTLRRVVDAVAGRLAEAQFDLQQVMSAHWVDTADDASIDSTPRLIDLPRIAALVPLIPFPDEETARRTPETVLVDETAVLTGPGNVPLAFDQLLAGQRLSAGGSRQADGTLEAARISVGQPLPPGAFDLLLTGRIAQITPPTTGDPVGRLVLLTGRSGVEMFRQRLKLTVEAFLEGAGTAPAILKMVAATMGWGPLQGSFADWSSQWSPANPVFEALAEGTVVPIRLRELPLQVAATPIARRVKSGARWIETNKSSFVVQPSVQFRALDQPVVIPTLVSLDAQVAISTLLAMETIKLEDGEVVEQDVTLRLEGQPDGTLRGTLVERRLPAGAVVTTDVTDRIHIQTSGLRVDREGASAFLGGGSDDATAGLVISNGQRAIRLAARGDGVWGNGIRVAHVDGTFVALTFDPALALGDVPSSEVHTETLTLDQLVNGASALVTAEDFTFSMPEGDSHWLYFDHMGWTLFDIGQWDRTVFDEPPAGEEDVNAIFQSYPAKGVYDYSVFNATVFPQEFLRAFRFDQADSVYNAAFFNETPEQVEVLLGWQEGQRATIRIDVPLASPQDMQRLAFLPEMIRKVKAAGVKVILVPRFLDTQPLGERPPSVRLRGTETLAPGDRTRLRIGLSDTQSLGDSVIGIFDQNYWNDSHFAHRSE